MHSHHSMNKSTMLHEEFGDMQRAACYLSLGLASSFPSALVEVTLFMGRSAPQRVLQTTTDRLEPIVERMAKRFPSHWTEVLYDPERRDGVVGIIRCACDHQVDTTTKHHLRKKRGPMCPLQCKENCDKPQVIVRLLAPAAGTPVAS